jgi:hypothetical protein
MAQESVFLLKITIFTEMNKIYSKGFWLFLIIFSIHSQIGKAQIIELGSGSFTGTNNAGPVNSTAIVSPTSRYAYIFPQSLVSTLVHGDSITSLDFLRTGGDTLMNTCNMKIFMRMTLNTTYGANNINWVNQSKVIGMKKVYDQNPKNDVGRKNTWVKIPLNTAFFVDTFFGKNLEILVEFTQSGASTTTMLWAYENRFSINGYANNQCKYYRGSGGVLPDTSVTGSDFHPSIKINFPRRDIDASIIKVYTLGKLPVPLGNPDTVKALIKNLGKKQFTNQKIYIISTGANKFIDSAYYSLDVSETKIINLPLLTPTKLGLDTIIVRIAKDEDSSQNEGISYRINTTNIYSYKDPTQPLVGGIGFNGSTGDFVAKFFSNNSKNINQISVNFAGQGTKFKLGIWKADGTNGAPKTNVWTSDTLTSAPNFITPVLPPVNVNGSFYVGVRQIGQNNVAFGYQEEDPVRPRTFYYTAPSGDTNWVDFAPDAPFKFAIEPRIQADDDVAPFSAAFTKDTISLLTVKTMAPKATIINYGVNDQNTPFNVTMNISRYGSQVYSSTKQDTLGSLRKHTITFDSTFLPTQSGNYDITVITKLGKDQMKDNDTLKKVLVVANYKDVGIGSLFDPDIYTNYEQFIDSVYPIANIQNFGLDAIGPFNVTVQVLDATKKILYADTKTTSLASGSSSLVVFNTYPCSVKGQLTFRIFTQYLGDTRKKNDTLSVLFNVVRSNDVAVTKAIYPNKNQVISLPATAKFINLELENFGDLNQANPFNVYCKILYQNNLVYYDSTNVNSFIGTTTNMFFKKFAPVNKGYYQLLCYSALPNDQIKKNDTLQFPFAYGLPDDVAVSFATPLLGSKLELKKVVAPKATVTNNGSNSQKIPFAIDFRVNQNLTNIYSSVKTMTIDSGQTKTISFDSALVLLDTGFYDVVVYTSLGKDFNKTNDTIKGLYMGVKYYDVGVSAVNYPVLSDTLLVNVSTVNPIITIKNYGDSLVKTRFSTNVKIINTATKVVLYNQTLDTAFKTNAAIQLTFPKSAKFTKSQALSITAQTNYLNDQYIKNDSAFANSQVEVWYDAIAQSIDLPINLATYTSKSNSLQPVMTLKNNGLKVLTGAKMQLIIKQVDSVTNLETTIYVDSVSVPKLNAGAGSVVNTNNLLDFSKQSPGLYKCYLTAISSNDQDLSNNALQSRFRIMERVGLRVTLFSALSVYPNPTSRMVMINLSQPTWNTEARLYDMSGKCVLTQAINQQDNVLDLSYFANGVYFLEVNTERLKLVIEH